MLRKQLIELGFTKYEINVYLCVLKKGITEASMIHKESKVPYGKIYETLNNLIGKGLIEVQNTRPKKYKPRKPNTAFNDILVKKKKHMEEDLENTALLIAAIGDEIDKLNIKDTKQKTFWITAMGKEIPELIRLNFEEAETEVCLLFYQKEGNESHHHNSESLDESTMIQMEMMKSLARGVKLRILSTKEIGLAHSPEDSKNIQFKNMADNIQIRYLDEPFPAYFTIIDDDKVVFSIIDPIEQDHIIAMTKVWDVRLTDKLKERFEKMWDTAKKIP